MLPQTQNPYAYSLNNPVNLSDPSGEFIDYLPDAAFIAMDIANCDWGAAAVDTVLGALPGVPAVFGVVKRAGQASNAIDAARIVIKTEHAARHLEGTGLAVDAVENAIRSDIGKSSIEKVGETVIRTIQVEGKTIEYRAHKLDDGTISVGTYFLK